jgi:hypothetical protein
MQTVINALVYYDSTLAKKFDSLEEQSSAKDKLINQLIEQVALLNEKVGSPTVSKTRKTITSAITDAVSENKKKVNKVNVVTFDPQKEIVKIVVDYAKYNKLEPQLVYNDLYQAYYDRYDEDIKALSENYRPKLSILTYATRHDLIEKLYMLAVNMFKIN